MHRGRIDVGAAALVVEADVAPDDRQAQGVAGLGQAVDGLGELPHDLGVLGVAEVEAVDHGDRRVAPTQARLATPSASTMAVPARGSRAHQRGAESVVTAMPRPLGGQARAGQPEEGGVAARARPRCSRRAGGRTGGRPRPGRPSRARRSAFCVHLGPSARRSGRRPSRLVEVGRAGQGSVVQRGVVGQRGGRDVGQHRAVEPVADAQAAHRPLPVGGRSGSVTLPTTVARTSQRRHTSATAGQSSGVTMASMRSWLSLVMTSQGSMPSSRRGTAETSTSMPTPPRAAVSLVAQARPAPPRSWMPTTRPCVEQGQARLDEALLLEGVAHLHARPLGVVGRPPRRRR